MYVTMTCAAYSVHGAIFTHSALRAAAGPGSRHRGASCAARVLASGAEALCTCVGNFLDPREICMCYSAPSAAFGVHPRSTRVSHSAAIFFFSYCSGVHVFMDRAWMSSITSLSASFTILWRSSRLTPSNAGLTRMRLNCNGTGFRMR